MAIGEVYQLNVNQTLYGVNLTNSYTFEQLADTSGGRLPENSLMEAWVEDMVPLQAAMSVDAWQMSCLSCRRVRPTGGVQFIRSVNAGGDIVGQGNASNTCCLGSLYSGTVGGRGRSRHWYSGVPVAGNAGGRLDAAADVLFVAFLDRLIQAIKWTVDNADFIIRVISSLDAIIRAIDQVIGRVRLRKLGSRRQAIC